MKDRMTALEVACEHSYMSRRMVAARADISLRSLERYLSGERIPPVTLGERLADILEVPLTDLWTAEGSVIYEHYS